MASRSRKSSVAASITAAPTPATAAASSSSDAPLTSEEKKVRRQQANRLSGSAAAAPVKKQLSLAEEMAAAERDGKSKQNGKSRAPKRKATAAELSEEAEADEDGDEEGEGEEDEGDDAAGAFAWDMDEPSDFAFGARSTGASVILPPSKQFQPFVQNTGTSLQHKIEKQLAMKQKKNESASKKQKSADSDEDMGSSSEDDEDSEGSDSEAAAEEEEEEEEAGAEDTEDVDADQVDDDVDMHAFKDDEVKRKTPSTSSGPKVIAATPLQRSANPIGDFASLKLSRPLLRAITDLGWAAPTPVQAASIMPAVSGKDLLVNAVTGSGKTGAFMLPILERLLYRPKRVPLSRVLVLLPTRELAAQCLEVSQHLSRYTDIRIALVVGGLSEKVQEQELRNKPDIILATPGRLIDHLRNTQNVHLEDIEILVLDEADRLLECGFAEELTEIIKEVRNPYFFLTHIPLSIFTSDMIRKWMSHNDFCYAVCICFSSSVRRVVKPYYSVLH
jgi:ATP-dependent RNA helicase DDX27